MENNNEQKKQPETLGKVFCKDKIFLIYPPSPVMNREDRCQQPADVEII